MTPPPPPWPAAPAVPAAGVPATATTPAPAWLSGRRGRPALPPWRGGWAHSPRTPPRRSRHPGGTRWPPQQQAWRCSPRQWQATPGVWLHWPPPPCPHAGWMWALGAGRVHAVPPPPPAGEVARPHAGPRQARRGPAHGPPPAHWAYPAATRQLTRGLTSPAPSRSGRRRGGTGTRCGCAPGPSAAPAPPCCSALPLSGPAPAPGAGGRRCWGQAPAPPVSAAAPALAGATERTTHCLPHGGPRTRAPAALQTLQ